ncbi:NAD-dependent epimerase/dehydratase family protein [Geojedonia litorea]|uniref:NAD-dependent epimerase/dehydratase family protein n=1 Tax=Geojedonia litorea TaxID=1268269 RepID=A0ABV9N7N8_9FLAO
MNTQITIIGCGWLGLPLAQHLIKLNYKVKGSTTSLAKIATLKNNGINAYCITINSDKITGPIENCLENSEALIINIPPGLRRNPNQNYVAKIKTLITHIEKSGLKKVLFVSSTSVYADEFPIQEITESTLPNPTTESGKQLLISEKLLQSNPNFKTTVLRFAGLIGPKRHPAKQLSGKSNLKNPEAPVNLIHLTDCISIIEKIITVNDFGETYNASTTPHPNKKMYYSTVCKAMGLNLPHYELSQPSKGKTISSKKLEHHFNYDFQIKLE